MQAHSVTESQPSFINITFVALLTSFFFFIALQLILTLDSNANCKQTTHITACLVMQCCAHRVCKISSFQSLPFREKFAPISKNDS